MRIAIVTTLGAALLASTLLLPATTWAQTTTTTTAATTTTPATTSRQEKVEQRIADMHETLHITAAEDPAFNSFAQVMLDNAQAMDMLVNKNAADTSKLTAVQSLQQYAEVTQQHAQNVQKLSAAFGTLYASLTPAQKKDADEMFRAAAADRQEKKDQKAGG